MSIDPNRLEALFALAVGLPSPAERPAFLDDACAGETALRRRLDALLRAYDAVGDSFLHRTQAHPKATLDAPASCESPGAVIGPYKLLEQLGEGGFGVVFLAEQTQPVRRKVALKVLKPGMDTRQVVARFEAERQALALMDHPNIAKVHDGGATPSGRPYFVMELVRGVPITQYCDEQRLTPRQRLELFVSVCQAVQHAHTKGVIHRDIKPSNVLVALCDDRPVPKVIDFGLAKATGPALTEQTLHTGVGAVVGTIEYMSPEQASLNHLDIDTRSDIYSLGVLLYELLTGGPPFSRKELENAGILDVLLLICEQEPPKPSTRLSSAIGLPALAANRGTEPNRLKALVRGELDWIVMKALEKDRNRRYETASAFAADVQRYLNDEPVHACPPSLGYRLRKFSRRNRGALIAGGLLAVFALVLGVGTGWVLIDRSARRTATTHRVEQALAESVTLFRDGKQPEALHSAQTARKLLDAGVSSGLFDRVESWLSDLSMAGRLGEARLLASGINEESRFDFQATVRAYASAFRDHGIDVNASESGPGVERIRRSAIRENLIAALDHWANLPVVRDEEKSRLLALVAASDDDPWRIQVRASARQNAAALKLLAESPEVDRQPPSALILLANSLHALGETDSGVNLLRKVQQRHAEDFWINQELGYLSMYAKDQRPGESLRFFSVAVALRPQSPGARWRLANVLTSRGWDAEAFAEYQEALRLKPDYVHAHVGIGRICMFPRKDYPAALAAFSRALELDADNIFALHGRCGAYVELHEWDKAVVDSSRAVRLDPTRPNSWYAHGRVNRGLGNKDEALAAYSKAIELKPDYYVAIRDRGELYVELGQGELAAADFVRISEAGPVFGNGPRPGQPSPKPPPGSPIDQISRRIVQEPDSPIHWQARGAVYEQMGQWENAAGDYSKAIELKFPGHAIWMRRANVYMNLEQWEKAIADFTTVISLKRDHWEAWFQRGVAQSRLDRTEKAALDFEKALELNPKNLGIRFQLGHAYRGLGQWDKAIAEFTTAIEVNPKADEYVLARGQTYSQMGQREKAIDDFSRAITLNPASSSGYTERGYDYAELGRWTEAAADFDKLVLIVRDEPSYWDNRAMAHLAARNEKAYREVCQEMIERFSSTKEPESAVRVVSACTAAPNAVKDPKALLALAELASREDVEWNGGFLAAAQLRAKDFPAAIESMKKATAFAERPTGLLIVAMAHHHLGHDREAQELLQRAEKTIAAAGRYNRRATSTDDDWQNWLEEVGARALLAEARAMVSTGTSKPK